LTAGQRPTPKGFFTVTERGLREVPIPPPSDRKKTKGIIDCVTRLIQRVDEKTVFKLEEELKTIAHATLKIYM
jgi:hypothetical protein